MARPEVVFPQFLAVNNWYSHYIYFLPGSFYRNSGTVPMKFPIYINLYN
jgi:hypothetical protein